MPRERVAGKSRIREKANKQVGQRHGVSEIAPRLDRRRHALGTEPICACSRDRASETSSPSNSCELGGSSAAEALSAEPADLTSSLTRFMPVLLSCADSALAAAVLRLIS